MTIHVLCKTLVPWLCSRLQLGIKVIIRGIWEHLLHTVKFLVTIVCWHQLTENSFKRYFLIYLRPLSSASKAKLEKSRAHANRLGEYIYRLSVKSKR